MYRPKSVQQFSGSFSITSPDSSNTCKLDIPASVSAPYDNAKLKPTIRGRLMPWAQLPKTVSMQHCYVLAQLLLLFAVVGLWLLHIQARVQVSRHQ